MQKSVVKNSRFDFFGIKTASFSFIIFQRANYQRRVLLISAGATEGHFEGKTPREAHQGGLVLARQCPGSLALATQKKLAYLGFQYLDHLPYSPDLAP